jgi:hypothetical protein
MKADISKIPFSVFGSYFKVEKKNNCFYVFTIHRNFEDQRINSACLEMRLYHIAYTHQTNDTRF